MGSSGGTQNFSRPATPTPPGVAPFGETAPFTPSYTSFLGGDPMKPYTGISPAQMQQIAPQASPQQANAAAAGGGAPSNYQQMLSFFQQMLPGGGRFSDSAALTPLGRVVMGQRNAPKIPAPGAGASAADLAAYQAAQDQQQTGQRDQLARAMQQMRQGRGGQRNSGGRGSGSYSGGR